MVYRNRSNFKTTGTRREFIASPRKQQHSLPTDPYSAVGREDMNIHEGPVALIRAGRIFEDEAMKRSSS